MTIQELYNIALQKPVLSDEEAKDILTEKDIDTMTNSAWIKCMQLVESSQQKQDKKVSIKKK